MTQWQDSYSFCRSFVHSNPQPLHVGIWLLFRLSVQRNTKRSSFRRPILGIIASGISYNGEWHSTAEYHSSFIEGNSQVEGTSSSGAKSRFIEVSDQLTGTTEPESQYLPALPRSRVSYWLSYTLPLLNCATLTTPAIKVSNILISRTVSATERKTLDPHLQS